MPLIAAAIVVLILIAFVPAFATVIGAIAVLGSIIVFGWGVVGLAAPNKVGMPDRGHAVGAWIVSVGMFIVGAIILPDRSPSTDLAPVDVSDPPRAERGLVADETSRETVPAGVSSRVYPGVESTRRIATDLVSDMGLQVGPLDAIPESATFTDFHWGGQPSVGGLRALLNGSQPSLSHLQWHEADGVVRFRLEKVAEPPAPPPPELTTEQKEEAQDRMHAAADRVADALSDIGMNCAQPASRVAAVAYAKCVGSILERICPDIGEGALNDMSDAARDMGAPESASLLEQASWDCWNAVYWADTPNGGRTLPRLVGEAVTDMGEKLAEASARLR